MTAFDHLTNIIGHSFTLWKNGGIIADGPLEFIENSFQIENVCFDSGTVELILNKDIILNEIVVDNFEYCQHCGSDQMPMADDSCRDCGKPFLPPNH